MEGAVSSEEDSAQNQAGAAAHQDSGFAGRLRGHGECSGHAQSFRHKIGLRPRLQGERDLRSGTFRTRWFPACCPMRAPFTKLSRWTFLCRDVRRPPTLFFMFVSELLEGRQPDLSAKTRFGA